MAKFDRRKPIVELDRPGGKVMAYWHSAKDASEFYNIHTVNISYNVNGKTKQALGRYFRFATPKEIRSHNEIMANMKPETTEAAPLDVKPQEPQTPVDTIPEAIQTTDKQDDTLSPFARLLQESKKRFNKNSN